MSTRCDFYEGLGLHLTWAGALTRDGHEGLVGPALADAGTLEEYRRRRDALIAQRNGVSASQGWPWPWADSAQTGVAVTFALGQLWLLDGDAWVSYDDEARALPARLPDMLGFRNSTPAGRVAQRFARFNPALAQLTNDIPVAVMTEVARQVLRVAVHFDRTPDGYRTTELASDAVFSVMQMQEDLKSLDEDLQSLVRERQVQGCAHVSFDFLWWARDHLSDFGSGRTAAVAVTEGTPFLFGQPLPESMSDHRPQQVMLTTFDGIVGRRLTRGLDLLERSLPQLTGLRVDVALGFLKELSPSMFRSRTPHEWARSETRELEGQSLELACETAAGFEQVRKLLHCQWLRC